MNIQQKKQEYYLNNRDKIIKRVLARYNTKKQEILKYQMERSEMIRKNKKHPEYKKYAARHFYTPKKQMKECSICGDKKDLQRHHWNYNKPKLISIFCRKCHNIIHAKIKSKEE